MRGDKLNHMFDVDIATQYGVNAAIILNNLYFWCEHNRVNGKYFFDGLYWTYNSNKAMQELFPYMSGRQIDTAIQKLVDAGIVVKGHYSANKYDRTMWYALTSTGFSIMQKCKIDTKEKSNRKSGNGKSTITDINTDINTNINNVIVDDDNDNERPDFNTVEAYTTSNLMHMSPTNMQECVSFVEDLGEDLVRYAVDKACENGKRTWAYVKAILNAYLRDGIKTVGEAKAADEARQRKKNTPPSMPQTDTDMSFEALY